MAASDTPSLTFLVLAILSAFITCIQGQNCATKYTKFPGHTACLSADPNAVVFDLTDGEKTALLDQHNQMRSNVDPPAIDMLKMTWDNEVAMLAKKWVDSCRITQGGILNHDGSSQRLIPGRFSVGQNLASNQNTFAEAVTDWHSEVDDYTYGVDSTSKLQDIGHYTQIVWAKSYKLGCARAKCNGVNVYACNYAPAGNVVPIKKPYETGSSSQCKVTRNKLCDCGNLQCVNGSPLDVSSCSCDCSRKYSLKADCTLSCDYDDDFYCGDSPFDKAGCTNAYAVSVSQKCVKQCEVCPHALDGDGDNNGGDNNGGDNNGGDNNGGDNNGGDNNGGDNNGGDNGGNDDDDDDDDGSHTVVPSALVFLALLPCLYEFVNRFYY